MWCAVRCVLCAVCSPGTQPRARCFSPWCPVRYLGTACLTTAARTAQTHAPHTHTYAQEHRDSGAQEHRSTGAHITMVYSLAYHTQHTAHGTRYKTHEKRAPGLTISMSAPSAKSLSTARRAKPLTRGGYIHTSIHPYIHIYIYTYTHIHIGKSTQKTAHEQKHTHAHKHRQTPHRGRSTHSCTHTRTHTCTHAHT